MGRITDRHNGAWSNVNTEFGGSMYVHIICMIQICDVFTGIYDMYGMYAGTGSFCYDALRRSNKSNCEKRKDEI